MPSEAIELVTAQPDESSFTDENTDSLSELFATGETMATPDSTAGRERVTVQLGEGETLRILAEKHFGNRDFWVYIYLENREVISDPNQLPVGIDLYIPDREPYRIDPHDPLSVNRAKEIGESILSS